MATWRRRLSDYDVTAIRRMAELGVSQQEIARVMHCSVRTVNFTVNGYTHTNLPVLPHRTKPLKPGSYRFKLSAMKRENIALRRQLKTEGNTS